MRQRTKYSLVQILADLLDVRAGDPYRHLNPLGWWRASSPPDSASSARG